MANPHDILRQDATYICDSASHLALSDDSTLSALVSASAAVWVIRSHMGSIQAAASTHLQGKSGTDAYEAIERATGSLSQLLTLLAKKEAAQHGAIATVIELFESMKTSIGGH